MVKLAPYVPRVALEWAHDAPGSRYRAVEGTLLFADVSGFTALSEKMAKLGKLGAEELTVHLDEVFATLLADASRWGGSLAKFGGDALLIFFWGEEHARRGCTAAAAMRDSLRRVGLRQTESGRVRLRMSMGVHSDTFDLFLVGDSHRELIVAGAAATTAARAEAAATAGEILLTGATASHLPPTCVAAAAAPDLFALRRSPRVPELAAPIPADQNVDAAPLVPESIRAHVLAGARESEHRHLAIGFLRASGLDACLADEGGEAVAAYLDTLIVNSQALCDTLEVTFLTSDIWPDGVKVLFVAGAPSAHEDDEDRIVRMMRILLEQQRDVSPLRFHAGLNAGHAFVGDVGAPFRRAYTVMGDAVNTAARVMAHAGPGQLLATDDVLRRCRTMYDVKELSPFAAKGKATPLVAYAVGQPLRGLRHDPRHHLPLIGRDQELTTLLRAVDQTANGVGGLIEVVGEPGMGKTRLVDEFVERCVAEQCGVRIVRAACQPYEADSAYAAVRLLIGSALELADSGLGATADDLRRRVEHLVPDLLRWLPLIGLVLDVSVPSTPESEALDPRFVGARVHRVIADLLEVACAERALFVLEDIHWMDPASTELVTALSTAVLRQPWVLCYTTRPAVTASPFANLGRTVVALAPIASDEAVKLARAAAGRGLFPEDAAAVAQRAGGNPLFLTELAAQAVAGDDLPASVESALAARLDRLAPPDLSAIRTAAAAGQTFDPLMVEQLVEGGRVGWHRLAEFVEPSPEDVTALRFRHALIRDVAYAGLTFRRRRALHGQIAERMEGQAQDADAIAERLSLHFHEARRYDKSWHYLRVAAERARRKSAHIEAATFLRRAIEAAKASHHADPDLTATYETLADECRRAGRLADALGAYRDARRHVAPDSVRAARLLHREGSVHRDLGQTAAARRSYRRALVVLGSTSPRDAILESRLSLGFADAHASQGNYRRALPDAEKAVRLARQAHDVEATANALQTIGTVKSRLGVDGAEEDLAKSAELYEQIGSWSERAGALTNLGVAATLRGDWHRALELHRSARDAFDQAGNVVWAGVCAVNIAEILMDQGHLQESRALLEDTLAVWLAARSWFAAEAKLYLGRLLGLAGDFRPAHALLDDALDAYRRMGMASMADEVRLRHAEIFLREGGPSEAASICESVTSRGPRRARLLAISLFRRDGLDVGDQLRHALQLARESRELYEEALVYLLLAEANDDSEYEWDRLARAIFDRLGVIHPSGVPLSA